MIKEIASVESAVNMESEARKIANIAERYFGDRAYEQFGERLSEGQVSKNQLQVTLRDTIHDHCQSILKNYSGEEAKRLINRAVKMVLGKSETASKRFTFKNQGIQHMQQQLMNEYGDDLRKDATHPTTIRFYAKGRLVGEFKRESPTGVGQGWAISKGTTAATPLGTVQRINLLIKKAGRKERLIRSPRGYYYLIDGDAFGFPYQSMYVYRLDNTSQDFAYAFDWLKQVYKDAAEAGIIKQVPNFDALL